MSVIHIVPSIAEEASGGTYAVVNLCESLAVQGQLVTLAVLDWAPLPSPPPFLKTFPLGLGPRRLGCSPAMKGWLSKTAQAGAVDLLHNHSSWMMPNVYPGWVAKRHGVPLIVSPHGTLSEWAMQSGSTIKSVFWPWVQKPALTATTCFHATAESEYEDIRRMGFHQPVAVIPNGIDIPDLAPKTLGESRTLLFLGRIHPIKGIDVLLHAWQAVMTRFPDWDLQIIGPDNGGYLAEMQALTAQLRLQRVAFPGVLYGEEKQLAYREASLFILPTHSENFGMTVAEALAAGTPAIVSKGAPWAGLEQQGAGWWIDIGVDPLVACLEDALSRSPEDLAEMGQNGRSWMEAEFSWAQVGQRMAETYRWILNGGNKPNWVVEG
ncbi:MAG: glycosyltransferase [Candidatus Competibacteraceae bacterium]|nr:MAG: glycosyltransferase [Candidatus Competibacteraceae bacterium]